MENRPGLARSIPFALFIGIMVSEPFLRPLLSDAFDPRWLYAVRASAVLVALAVLWRHYTELRNRVSTKWSGWILGVGVGIAVFGVWIHLDLKPLAFTAGEGFDPRTGETLAVGLIVARLAGAALIVPVMEELFWRSFLFRWIQNPDFLSVDPSGVGIRALLISSVLFASEHRLWFAGLLAGLAYAWVYKRTGNLWVPVVAHAVTNGLLGAYVLATGQWSFW